MQKYSKLLSPVKIGNHVIKSRMMYPNASPHFLQGPENFPAVGMRAFHAGLARNGAGIVTIAEWNEFGLHQLPAELDRAHFQVFDLSDPSVHNYLSMMADEVHFCGGKLLICLRTIWPEGYTLYGLRPMGPPVPGKTWKMAPKEIIEQSVQMFVERCKMYKGLGYDGVSLRCDMELAGVPGVTRDDEYDPSNMESRSLYMRQLYAAVKKKLGDDFITEATVAWEQPWGYGDMAPGSGMSEEEVLTFCKLADKDVDIFQVREHDATRSHPMGFNMMPGDHPAADACKRMKEAGITALLCPIGGFQEPDEMEKLLEEGVCDMFAMARAFIADPEYGIKMKAGKGEDITPCIKCNKCHGEKITGRRLPWACRCSVNPYFGLEQDLDWLTARSTTGKKVAVIGGGPAGMRAAIEATKLGHSVTLYEQSGVLGGQLIHADSFDFKWPIKNYKEWLIRQMDVCKINVIMNCKPTNEMLQAEGYDTVIAATGAVPKILKIDGAVDAEGKALYPTCDDVWGKEAELGKHVIMVGGSETCMETAIYLLRAGHKVTMLTRQKEVAHDASKLHSITWVYIAHNPDGTHRYGAEWEKYEEFTGITQATTKAVNGNTVTYIDADGNEQTITGDSVVLYGGRKALLDEAMEYVGAADQVVPIGDCAGAGNLANCNRQALATAYEI